MGSQQMLHNPSRQSGSTKGLAPEEFVVGLPLPASFGIVGSTGRAFPYRARTVESVADEGNAVEDEAVVLRSSAATASLAAVSLDSRIAALISAVSSASLL